MENYKNKLKKDVSLLALVCCLGASVFIIGQQLQVYCPEGSFGDFFRGFQIGIFIALELSVVASIGYIGRLLRDEAALKKSYIKATDERNLRISEKSGQKLCINLIIPLLISTIFAGYFSAAVFFTLLGTICFIIVVTAARLWYFSKTM